MNLNRKSFTLRKYSGYYTHRKVISNLHDDDWKDNSYIKILNFDGYPDIIYYISEYLPPITNIHQFLRNSK